MKTGFAALAFLFLSGVSALAGTGRPVVVEFYTSQGCNTCLAANQLANKLAQKPGVLALSFSVTYWDMFGWKDTLASEDNTKRQKSYASALHRGGVYTPQIIIDGWRDVPATKPDAVGSALETALSGREDIAQVDNGAAAAKKDVPAKPSPAWSVGVDISRTTDGLHVAIARAPEKKRPDATVWLFRLRSSAVVKITGGESAGQTVSYRNVVTGIQNLGNWRGEARMIDIPHPTGKTASYDSVAVVVQQGGFGRVIGAAYQQGGY
jgi:hypothetical protein